MESFYAFPFPIPVPMRPNSSARISRGSIVSAPFSTCRGRLFLEYLHPNIYSHQHCHKNWYGTHLHGHSPTMPSFSDHHLTICISIDLQRELVREMLWKTGNRTSVFFVREDLFVLFCAATMSVKMSDREILITKEYTQLWVCTPKISKTVVTICTCSASLIDLWRSGKPVIWQIAKTLLD
jgi:hypothetical protein